MSAPTPDLLPESPPAPVQAKAEPGFGWDESGLACYELTFQVRAIDAASWRLQTRFAIQAEERSPSSVRFLLRFFQTTAPLSPTWEALFAHTPVQVDLLRDGRILDIRLPRSVNAEDATRLSNVISACQVILRPETAYQVVETDANGSSTWRYRRSAEGLKKERLAFAAKADQPFQTTVNRSAIVAKLGPFWLDSIEGSEAFTINLPGESEPLAQPTTEWKLRRIPTPEGLDLGPTPPTDWASAQDPSRASASDEPAVPAPDRSSDLTAEDALKRLEERSRQMTEDTDIFPEIEALADLLRARPERADELARLLRDPSLSDPVRAWAMHALELAARDSAPAQSALAEFLRNPESASPEALSQAIVAAGGVGLILDPALVEALSGLATGAEDPLLSDAATFALGRLAETNPAIRDLITPGLTAILEDTSQAPEDLKMALWTLRNGKITSELLRARAETLSRSVDPGLRAAAGQYLELYDQPGD